MVKTAPAQFLLVLHRAVKSSAGKVANKQVRCEMVELGKNDVYTPIANLDFGVVDFPPKPPDGRSHGGGAIGGRAMVVGHVTRCPRAVYGRC